ncbi:MAG: phosphoglucosamine mutase [Candidatus Sericytochromatia bacterium]
MAKLFGTDGVRGIANTVLTPELAFKLGRIGGYILTKDHKSKSENNFIIVGRDTRQSGDMLNASLNAGICSIGVDVWDLGIAPTPVVAWLVRECKALAGVVISASHNPAKDNGIKFFNNQGNKLDDEIENKIEEIIELNDDSLTRPTGGDLGIIHQKSELITSYLNYIETVFKDDFSKLKIGVDTANGANSYLAPMVYNSLDIDYSIINNNPDGKNINFNCGSTHLDSLKKFVIENKLDLGIAFDGDADRVLAIDETGRVVDGDEIMMICSKYLNQFKDNHTIVATVMSNLGFEIAMKKEGKNFIRAKVGDRYVSEQLYASGSKLGGEQSGHIIMLDYNTTGDGLLTSIMLMESIINSGKSLKELKDEIVLYPQVLINVQVKTKEHLNDNYVINSAIKKAEQSLGENGRILVRPSGTEPLVRVMVEGSDMKTITEYANEIAEAIKKELYFSI